MDIEKVNAMIANLVSKREWLQNDINKKREDILRVQEDVAGLQEKVQEIDKNIAEIKLRADKDKEREQSQNEPMVKKPIDKNSNPLGVEEEADAATNTGSLDASSVSSGGNFGGWRHYSKMGEVSKRSRPKKKKKKKIVEFVDSFFELIENGE